MDLIHVSHSDTYWSKILCTFLIPVHDLKVKATEFLCKTFVLKFLQFKFLQILWWIWFMYDMLIKTCPKSYAVPVQPLGQDHKLEEFLY